MAEAILFAASDILRRQETLRIVMVVTDGDPNELASTKEVIKTVRAAGVTVVGLGIGVDPSEVFGEPYSATLHDVAELSGAMVKLIKSSMVR
jgi:cobalamin biosynthesis protein CobT